AVGGRLSLALVWRGLYRFDSADGPCRFDLAANLHFSVENLRFREYRIVRVAVTSPHTTDTTRGTMGMPNIDLPKRPPGPKFGDIPGWVAAWADRNSPWSQAPTGALSRRSTPTGSRPSAPQSPREGAGP